MLYPKKIKISSSKYWESVFLLEDVKAWEVVFYLEPNIISHPTRTSVQIKDGVHQECVDIKAPKSYLNHFCNPNWFFDFDKMSFIALRDIKKDEELWFDYMSTEWDTACKFQCKCWADNCYWMIRWFKYINREQQEKITPILSDFLKSKLS